MTNLTHQLHLDALFTALVTVEGDVAYLHSCSEHLAAFEKKAEAMLIRRAIRNFNKSAARQVRESARPPRDTLIGVAPPALLSTNDRVRRGEHSRTRYRLTADLVQT